MELNNKNRYERDVFEVQRILKTLYFLHSERADKPGFGKNILPRNSL